MTTKNNKPYLTRSKENWEEKKKLIKEFKEVSGIDLNDYKSITGFDIISLNREEVQTPDGKAMSDYIEEKWGKKYRDLIASLI